jgi:hypothetical protein
MTDAQVNVVSRARFHKTPIPAKAQKNSPTVLTVMRIERGKTWSVPRATTSATTARTSARIPDRFEAKRAMSANQRSALVPSCVGRKTALAMRYRTRSARAARARMAVRFGAGSRLRIGLGWAV